MTVPLDASPSERPGPDPIEVWVRALLQRHAQAFTRPEFLKAIRALSARYVEQRASLPHRSPLDSAGKRAAFAAFYTPLHAVTVRAIVTALDLQSAGFERLLDLGCGTGAASIGWAMAGGSPPQVVGVDRDRWATQEAAWNWRHVGLSGRAQRGDLLDALASSSRNRLERTVLVCGWSVNELDATSRARALSLLIAARQAGASALVIEPVARTAAPWWPDWTARVVEAGGRDDLWKFPPLLPPSLADLDEAAGFRREALGARTLWLGPHTPVPGNGTGIADVTPR